jgi:hypothetical protein
LPAFYPLACNSAT